MRQLNRFKICLLGTAVLVSLYLAVPREAAAHCDTLDGPVIQDARKAIDAKDITPILKWVKSHDEKAVKTAFNKVLAGKSKNREEAEHKFFATLVKIHRAGEGAPYTGLKPAGAVESAVAEADKALSSGSAGSLVKLVTDDIAEGIKKRFEQTVALYKQKDDSVAQGRKFVEAYVEYTHYVERLHQDAVVAVGHAEHAEHAKVEKHQKHKKEADHSRH